MTDHARSILLATWEAGGTIAPMLTVARKLVARGHRVHVIADESTRDEAIAAGAVAFTAWTSAPSKPSRAREHDYLNDWQAPTPADGIQLLIDSVLIGAADGYARDMRALLDRETFDLVVSSEFLFGVHAACEAAGQPFALFAANIALLPQSGAPPLGPGLRPATTDAERAEHAAIAEAVHAMFDRGLPRLNAVRADLGLAPIARVADQHRAALRQLLGTSRAFDFESGTPDPHISYVGPQLGDPAWAQSWTSPFPPRTARKRVLVSFSTTFQNHVDAMQRVLDAVAPLPLDAVVTLGGSVYAHELRAPDNVVLIDSAPHGPAMADADIVVTHGGHGTVMKALVAQKPMLIIPHGRDQVDNAVRVTERGAGVAIAATASVDEIREALHRLSTDAAFADAARALGARVAADADASPVAEVIEALAEHAVRPRSGLRAA